MCERDIATTARDAIGRWVMNKGTEKDPGSWRAVCMAVANAFIMSSAQQTHCSADSACCVAVANATHAKAGAVRSLWRVAMPRSPACMCFVGFAPRTPD
eukprot:4226101-Alexandrium_andersonii.AAC.1